MMHLSLPGFKMPLILEEGRNALVSMFNELEETGVPVYGNSSADLMLVQPECFLGTLCLHLLYPCILFSLMSKP